MNTFETVQKSRGLLLVGALLLTACAGDFRQQVSSFQKESQEEDRSFIIYGFELRPNYVPRSNDWAPAKFYDITVRFSSTEQPDNYLRDPIVRRLTPNVVWSAFSVEPGTYSLKLIAESAKDSKWSIFSTSRSTDFTMAAPGSGAPVFEVGKDDAVYVGTLVVDLKTVPTSLGGRYLEDAKKSYRIESGEARGMANTFRVPAGWLRDVDLFAGNDEARSRLELSWQEWKKSEQ